jgi:micrococcal nuclease
MKTLLGLLLFTLSLSTSAQQHDFKITRVIDGDTVGIEANYLPRPLKPELLLRIYGVDTPEKGGKAQCDNERIRAEEASKFTKQVISRAKTISITLWSWDKYGGRVLGDVFVDGISLRSMLIRNGHAREYFGDRKQSWC